MNKMFLFFTMVFSIPMINSKESFSPQEQKNASVAIRIMVNFLEFTQLVYAIKYREWRDTLNRDNNSDVGYLEAFDAMIATFPLGNKKLELLKKFGNKKFYEDVSLYYNPQREFSQESKEHIRLVIQSSSILVESLYREHKITEEQKNLIQDIVDKILKSGLIK